MSEAPYGNPLAQVVLRAADAFDRGCDRDDLRSAHTRMYLWRMGARDVFRSRSRVPTEVPCLLLSVGDVYGFRPAPSGRYKAEATKYYSYLCAAAEFCGVDPEMQISELSGDVSRACRSAAMEAASLAGPRQDADWSVSADWIRSVDAAASRVRHRLLSKLSASPSEASCAADDLRAECDAAIRAARVDPRAPTMKQETIILGKMGYRLLSGTGARRFPPGAMPPFQTDIRGRDLLPHEAATRAVMLAKDLFDYATRANAVFGAARMWAISPPTSDYATTDLKMLEELRGVGAGLAPVCDGFQRSVATRRHLVRDVLVWG